MTFWDFLNAHADGIGGLIFAEMLSLLLVGMLSLLLAYVTKKFTDLD